MPPEAKIVTVPVPPLQAIGVVTFAEVIIIALGSVTSIFPETGPQLFLSVTLHARFVPATIPVNIPVEFVTPLKVYESGAVPPEAEMVTVAVAPLQVIAVVIGAETVKSRGSVISIVPVTGPQLSASVTLQLYVVPAPVEPAIPEKTPVAFVTPSKV